MLKVEGLKELIEQTDEFFRETGEFQIETTLSIPFGKKGMEPVILILRKEEDGQFSIGVERIKGQPNQEERVDQAYNCFAVIRFPDGELYES